jgi:hypothetical protein
MALWRVGEEARHFTFGIVALTWLFLVLWVSIGNGIHKNYETPTPVYTSGLLISVIHR